MTFGSRLKKRLRRRRIPLLAGCSSFHEQVALGGRRGSSGDDCARGRYVVGLVAITRPVERPLVRLDVDLGPDVSLGPNRGTDTILSPDGTQLVYVSQGRLFTRRLDQPNATELAGTQGAVEPFFSPDGQWVAFFTSSKSCKRFRWRVARRSLCVPRPFGMGGSWGEDGNITIASLSLQQVACHGFPPPEVRQHQ